MKLGKLLCVWAVLVLIGTINFVRATELDELVVDLDEGPKSKQVNPKIESVLVQLHYVFTKDRGNMASFSRKHGMTIRSEIVWEGQGYTVWYDSVRVFFDFEDYSEENIEDIESLGVKVETSEGNLVQALVPVFQLQSVSKLPFVKYVMRARVHSAAREDHVVDLDSNIIDVDFEKSIFNPKYEHKLKQTIDDKIKSGKNEEEIQLIIETDVFSENYIDSLEEQGVIVEKNYINLVQVKVKVRDVEKLVENDFIKRIKTPTIAYPDLVSEGVEVIGAETLHSLSITGDGVKVAILDGGFLGYGALLGTELPSNVVTQSFHVGGIEAGGSHGTACAEIVHDVAPSASLYLVNFDSLGFYQAMNWLIAQDVDVISFSISFFLAGPGDGTGLICEKVDEAANAGILFVKSAGNYAESHYEGYFQSGDLDKWHDFDIGDEGIPIYAYVGDTIRLYLSWSASWPTYEDYDLWLWNSSGFVAWSLNQQDPSGYDPVESISYDVETEGWYYVGIEDYSTSASWELELFSPTHNFYDHRVPSSSLGIPADAVGSFTVGATYWFDDSLEPFSSRGPTNDGRIKPDVTAPDGVTNSVYDPFPFFGTSASAPHTAGAAALLLSYHPSLTVAQIKSSLEDGSFDLGATGRDNLYGEGRIDVYESYVDIKYNVTLPVNFGAVIADGTYIQTDVITAGGVGNIITVTGAAQSGGTVDTLEELRYVEGTVTGASGVPLIIWDEDSTVSSWTAITLGAGEQLSLEAYAGMAPGTWGAIVITLTVS